MESYQLESTRFVNPSLVSAARRGDAEGLVEDSQVHFANGESYGFENDAPNDGTEVAIRVRDGSLVAVPKDRLESWKKEKKRDQQHAKALEEREQRRRKNEKRREAERFWERFDIPFNHDVAIKNVMSGLSRGSSGTGRNKSTVEHLYAKESFTDGRLSREAEQYVCDPSAHLSHAEYGSGTGERRTDGEGESYIPPVTCSQCLKIMNRKWEETA